MDEVYCVICQEKVTSDGVLLTSKGIDGINNASRERGDTVEASPGDTAHKACRRNFCRPSSIRKELKEKTYMQNESGYTPRSLRSQSNHSESRNFCFKTDCFYCGCEIDKEEMKRRSRAVCVARTLEMQKTVLSVCNKRGDEWADQVRARILHVHDLPAADAIYHQDCSSNFRKERQMPSQSSTDQPGCKKRKLGRPRDKEANDAFFEVIHYLQKHDDEQLTVSDLVKKMEEFSNNPSAAYSNRYMKVKLEEHFRDNIIITNLSGKSNVVTLRETAASILHEFHEQQRNDNPEQEKVDIIETAAKLIKSDIKLIQTSNEKYPSIDTELEKHLDFLPTSLKLFLDGILVDKSSEIKKASIGQAIIQSARPRAILAPLQVGLAVQLHHSFASRFLVDTVHRLGFCSSYKEVLTYNQNAAVDQGADIPEYNGEFVQYVADNVDHNLRTLDGNDTFHGMGIIATVTPGTRRERQVPRRKVTSKDIAEAGKIEIHPPSQPRLKSLDVRFNDITLSVVDDPTSNLDILWKSSLLFGGSRPSWAGMMQTIHAGSHNGRSSVAFLPMIDMSPSEPTCVNSTLEYVVKHAQEHSIEHPILTFDQPLWWKAYCIINTENASSPLRNIILRLGGFHTEMSFLGSIGNIMAGSGLREILEMIYAPTAVEHMLSGKAVARAVRGHLIIDAALNALLYSTALGSPIPHLESAANARNNEIIDTEDKDGTEVILEAKGLYESLMESEKTPEEVSASKALQIIRESVSRQQNTAKAASRTAALWLQYMEMIDLLRDFIKAERLAKWELHLQVLDKMLPYFAASGHNLYTKSVHLYIQSMEKLKTDCPQVYHQLASGYHVVRRSARTWAGLSADLVIEQVLMRSLKTTGGLTRGSGMTERQRLTWLLSMPACAETNCAMQELTGVKYDSSEQNKDMTSSRQKRDMHDTVLILNALVEKSPFTQEPALKNIMTGVHADHSVNVDQARKIGGEILESMIGKSVTEHSFKRKKQCVTLATRSSVRIEGEKVHIDPQLLFQRLLIASMNADNLEEIFQHELCSYPTALFDSPATLRQPQKSMLADSLWAKLSSAAKTGPVGSVDYVLDGGALLHRVPWPRQATYEEICSLYCQYVQRKYSNKATVVFDGYNNNPSTKSMTHLIRSVGKTSATVTFQDGMKVTMKKDAFLSNTNNKKRFLDMLQRHLTEAGCHTVQAEGDADVLIVKTAVESAAGGPTVLVGDDTDLIILLCHHMPTNGFDLYFRPEQKPNSKENRVWNMRKVVVELGMNLCQHLLFLHAVLGCDTTSRPFGIGKAASIKKFKDAEFQDQAKVFDAKTASADEIQRAGENALVMLYGGRKGESLDALRYRRYYEKVATKGHQIQPQNLPPSSAAAKYHSLRVFLQVKQWQCNDAGLMLEDYGWKVVGNQVLPLTTDLPAAPQAFLKMIRCNCTTDCATRSCSCRKHGLECSPACGQCHGTACTNSSIIDDSDDDKDYPTH